MYRWLFLAMIAAGCMSASSHDSVLKLQKPPGSHPYPVIFANLGVNSVDTAGGVDVYVRYGNADAGTVRYLSLWISAYNGVGDLIVDDIDGHGWSVNRIVGPIEQTKSPRYMLFDGIWYNRTVACVRLDSVEVEYMDGREFRYGQPDVDQMFVYQFENNDCSYEGQQRRR